MFRVIVAMLIGAYLYVIVSNFRPEYSDAELHDMLVQTEMAYDKCQRKLEKYEVKGTYTFTNEK